ncbi:ATP-binding protein [Paenibacillus hexagrammi]|uniref:histidine kinase n=1 Tax=Paenibacillus hexagrammi TaxID=2908839 RepID=A0ABY3SF50_9BACL|nr:ATP-binding protein [Paenibacillus sp. YPD9-1]UJF31705.1 response regulator [Paenibacillus sp. YPD9-1]
MEEQVKILAVDDRYENLLALQSILASCDCDLVTLQSGEEVLKYLLKEPAHNIAAILMDVQMPGLNGFETTELIKQKKSCEDIPIIFLTAISTSIEHVLRGYHAGSIDYVFKPVHPELLKMKVDAFIKLHRVQHNYMRQSELLHSRTLELEAANHKLAAAEMLLKQQNEQLEKRVEERTRELIEAHNKLMKSQAHFKKMFQASPCLMTIRNLSTFEYIDVNESWKYHTGYGDEVIGTSLNPMNQTADTSDEPRLGELYQNYKVKYETKQKEIRSALVSTEIIEMNDEKCLLQVGIDITETLRYETEMARLAQLNLVGEMAAGIAHEIRNPMTTIRGFLQLFRNSQGRMDNEYIEIMLEELDRANDIITEYLSLAKNKRTYQNAMQLNRILETLSPLIQAEAVMTGKHFHVHYGECPDVQLDDKEIRQLILNICINGLEAMEAGGKLTVQTYSESEHVILKISDEGGGIQTEHLEKLGRPFFTTKEHGTGLGLAVCYSIAARHNAKIEVQSSPAGTTFTIKFIIPVPILV